jgi:flavodoxin
MTKEKREIVVYYSYSGRTKAIAETLAEREGADIVEVKDVKRPRKIKAFTLGIVASARGKSWAIQSLDVDLTVYDKIILLAPVWADNPAPAFNSLLELLPPKKSVSIKLVSMSGKSSCIERLEISLKEKNCVIESYEDIKA